MPDEREAPEPQPPETARVLVVDDNADAAQGLDRLLRHWGWETEVALDGKTALAKAEEFRPDVVLLDIGLPVHDGYEVAAQLRKMPTCRDATLIAVTGYGQEEDRHGSEEAGFDFHLVKPINTAELRKMMAVGLAIHGRQ